MGSRGKNWVEDNQAAIAIGNEEAVPSKQRANIRNRLEKKVNRQIPQVLSLLPDVLRFLTSDAQNQIRNETSPHRLGNVFGRIYSQDQRQEMVYALLQQEEEYGDNPEAAIRKVADQLGNRTSGLETDFETLNTFDRVRRLLFRKLKNEIDDQRRLTGVRGTISQIAVARWIASQESDSTGLGPLPRLFSIIVDDDDATSSLNVYADEIRAIVATANREGSSQDRPDFDKPIDFQEPAEEDFQVYLRALELLKSEFERAVERYWSDKRIVARDILLSTATETVQGKLPQEQDREILRWVPCQKNREGWSRYYTRRANQMIDMSPPVLEPRRKGDETIGYTLTAFGRFVKAFINHDSAGNYDGHLIEFTTTLETPESCVEAALDEAARVGR